LKTILKLIVLRTKNNESGNNNNKELIEKEMKIGMIVAKESDFLVSNLEIFEWEDYFCIKMKYCSKGDIQSKFEEGRTFTEEV
jgi:hypothetical protein